jgi:hypothetical protein
MSNGCKECETALANIAIIAERSTTRTSAKLEAVKIPSDEAYFMLAAFCFDLSRKMNYLFKATREFGLQGDPELAQQFIEDNEAINKTGLTWEQRARAAEAIMLRSVQELGEEHERLLVEVAGKAAHSR